MEELSKQEAAEYLGVSLRTLEPTFLTN